MMTLEHLVPARSAQTIMGTCQKVTEANLKGKYQIITY